MKILTHKDTLLVEILKKFSVTLSSNKLKLKEFLKKKLLRKTLLMIFSIMDINKITNRTSINHKTSAALDPDGEIEEILSISEFLTD